MKKRQKTKPDRDIGQAWMRKHQTLPTLKELLAIDPLALPCEPPAVQKELFTFQPASWELAELQKR
ncbi:MAG: hypothetical protein WCJ35_21725 [Planctomycetota bacterium]